MKEIIYVLHVSFCLSQGRLRTFWIVFCDSSFYYGSYLSYVEASTCNDCCLIGEHSFTVLYKYNLMIEIELKLAWHDPNTRCLYSSVLNLDQTNI